MANNLTAPRRTRHEAPAWSTMAVMVEAMVLLVFLMASLAVLTHLFASAMVRATQGEQLAAAVSVATSAAERFSADPADAAGTWDEEGLEVACEVTPEMTATGTLYHATITVCNEEQETPVYVLTTTRFEREVS